MLLLRSACVLQMLDQFSQLICLIKTQISQMPGEIAFEREGVNFEPRLLLLVDVETPSLIISLLCPGLVWWKNREPWSPSWRPLKYVLSPEGKGGHTFTVQS